MTVIFNLLFFILNALVFIRSVFSAVLLLILIFFCTAIYLLAINVEFIAIIILIVYIGGICVLFLSAIFIINYHNTQKLQEKKIFFVCILGIIYVIIFIFNIITYPSINNFLVNVTRDNFLPYGFMQYLIGQPITCYLLTLLLLLGVIFIILITISKNKEITIQDE